MFLVLHCFYKQLSMLKPRSIDVETTTKVNLSSLAYDYSPSLLNDEKYAQNIWSWVHEEPSGYRVTHHGYLLTCCQGLVNI